MAGFAVISDVSNGVLKALRNQLCPEPVQSPESIQLASPADKNADFQLGLFLYDIREMGEYRASGLVRGTNNRRTFPPRPLTLCYMLFLNRKAQIAAGAEAEQRILGRSIQILSDYPVIDLGQAPSQAGAPGEDATVTFLNLSFEDKTKIWAALNIPYQVAVYFSVSPVLLSSTRSEEFVRVTESEISLLQMQPEQSRIGG